ncbi:hypothetical protein Tco_0251898 [Tanacetum coccineum]
MGSGGSSTAIGDMVLDRRSLEVEYCNKVHTGLTKKENLPLHGKESSSSEENLRGSPMHLSSSGNGCLAAFIDRNLIFQKRRLTKRGLDMGGHFGVQAEGEGCSLGSLLIDATIVGSGSASGGGSQGCIEGHGFLKKTRWERLSKHKEGSFTLQLYGATRQSEEPRIAKEVESNHKRFKKEIGKQDVLRRKVTIPLSLLENYRAVKDDEAGKSSNEVVTKEMAAEIAKEKGRVPSWQSYTSPSPLIGGNPQGNHTWFDKKAQGEIDFTLLRLTKVAQHVTSWIATLAIRVS